MTATAIEGSRTADRRLLTENEGGPAQGVEIELLSPQKGNVVAAGSVIQREIAAGTGITETGKGAVSCYFAIDHSLV